MTNPKQMLFTQFYDNPESIREVTLFIESLNNPDIQIKEVRHNSRPPMIIIDIPHAQYHIEEGEYLCVNVDESELYVLTQKEFLKLGKTVRSLSEFKNIIEKVSE